MTPALKRAAPRKARPNLNRPKRKQVAALCYKETGSGKKILLITSRDTGRWIVPKGWPIEGKDGPQSALQEAWEEAGVKKANVKDAPIGSYDYAKGMKDGSSVPIEAKVYLAQVVNLKKAYPEAEERERAWFTPEKAAELVEEPDLKDILKALA